MRGESVCRFKGFGQAQTMSSEENVFLLENSEEHAFLLGFWEVILPKMRFGQAQTLSYIENAFILGNSKENAFILGWLGQACGEGVLADLRGSGWLGQACTVFQHTTCASVPPSVGFCSPQTRLCMPNGSGASCRMIFMCMFRCSFIFIGCFMLYFLY